MPSHNRTPKTVLNAPEARPVVVHQTYGSNRRPKTRARSKGGAFVGTRPPQRNPQQPFRGNVQAELARMAEQPAPRRVFRILRQRLERAARRQQS